MVKFFNKTQRKIKLEIESGTYLVSTAGFILLEVRDIVDTKNMDDKGYSFIKINSGMNDNTRIAMYGVQHPIFHIKKKSLKISKGIWKNMLLESVVSLQIF